MPFPFSLIRSASRSSQPVALAFILLGVDIIVIGYLFTVAVGYFK